VSEAEQEASKKVWAMMFKQYNSVIPARTSSCGYCGAINKNVIEVYTHLYSEHSVIIQCNKCKICHVPPMWEGHVAANCDDSKNDALKKTFSFGVHVVTKDKIVSVEQRQEIQPGLAVTEFEETEIVD